MRNVRSGKSMVAVGEVWNRRLGLLYSIESVATGQWLLKVVATDCVTALLHCVPMRVMKD